MELRANDLLREWQAGKFRPVYYLFGEESAAKADAVLKLKELFNAGDFFLRRSSNCASVISCTPGSLASLAASVSYLVE